MYSTCLFCNQDLGKNEVIEHFPIGRRLAFDSAKGRLWVVCRKCERWNLTPVEERWEAIEEAERLFSESRLRVSTDNIGLARLREGLELVRIGAALRPEMAAWRYGDQFGRRRRRYMLMTGGAIAAAAGLVVLGPVTGIIATGGVGTWQVINGLHNAYQERRVRARLRLPSSDEFVSVRKKQLEKAAIVRHEDEWALRVPGIAAGGTMFRSWKREPGAPLVFTGAEALHAASKLLPALNEKGAKKDEVESAVTLVGEAGDPARLFNRYAAMPVVLSRRVKTAEQGHVLHRLPKEVRLALEMASHEEQERRALEGELSLLAAAWKEAEEIANIADDMFVSDSDRARLEELKSSG
jgi:hypothetical protein